MSEWGIPKFPLGEGIEAGIDWLVEHFAWLTKAIAVGITAAVEWLAGALIWPPAWVTILAFTGLAFWLSRSLRITIFTLVGLAFIWNIELWDPTMQTLALVILSTAVAIAFGIPLGILAAMFRGARVVIVPILDVMQTMPAFVYLIPAIPFFGLGETSALFSTVTFAMPPAIRLTLLGIQQVPGELVEAADAFGATRRQKLFKLQIPLALPSIRAGVNQTIMLSLSMVVIAAMIGAKGLGSEVWKAIQRLEAGMGFEAGFAIVILAIILDRIMQSAGAKSRPDEAT